MKTFGLLDPAFIGSLSSINYWGNGIDGALATTSSVSFTSTTDGDVVVKNYQNVVINTGHTVTVSNRCKGMIMYVSGDCTINGTLTMTARGASADPVAAGVSSSGLIFRRVASSGTQTNTGTNLLAGCGAVAIAAENNQKVVSGNGQLLTVTRTGASGASSSFGGSQPGGTGSSGSTGQTGGGGTGGLYGNGATGSGAAGTCFSGGPGGGGTDSSIGGAATANGGSGGAATAQFGNSSGGAGNPGGSGVGTGAAGTSGTGGLLVLVVKGTLTVGGTGIISSNGSAGGSNSPLQNAGGGGGSGAGPILVIYGKTLSNSGSIVSNGGPGGAGATQGPPGSYDGGAGGAGSIQTQQVLI